MKLGFRIFGCYLLIFLICFSYPIGWVMDNLRTRYLEGVEDPLADHANILAQIVGQDMASGRFDPNQFFKIFKKVYGRNLNSRIYHLKKDRVDLSIYITDVNGKVIFDSLDPQNIGADFRKWRDVQFTLDGKYGARTTLADPFDSNSSVLYVGAPIVSNGNIIGVLTVAKPTANINSFLQAAKPRFLAVAGVAAAVAVVLSYLAAYWMVQPIKRLIGYAEKIRLGHRAPFPKLDRSEIGDLGRALKRMQTALEGKAYVEQYVQKLTHEVKSPLSAIRGAAELLEEDVPEDRRRRFLTNIRTETNRIQTIVDRMLELAALEFKDQLAKWEPVQLQGLVNTVLESKEPILTRQELVIKTAIDNQLVVHGDPFLLHQAVSNLIQNAVDFSHPNGKIHIFTEFKAQNINLVIEDQGAGIPQYALEKIFDKFFSLQRPEGGRKSTGLGLNFVKQVAHLHNGDIMLENIEPKGVRAIFSLPHHKQNRTAKEK
jgi:two-component system sensor histidine kinase CreC